MKILVINCGSSSIKYKLFEFPRLTVITKGLIAGIGEEGKSVKNHTQGMRLVFSKLIENKAVRDLDEIGAIGHRVVHGGEEFFKPHLIDRAVMKKIEENCELAPLHNPANLAGIKASKKLLSAIPQIAVFDTAFHQSIPDYAYRYPLPAKYYRTYGIRKYGFHGTSHQYVAMRTAQILKKPLRTLKIITCHLGNGCSITAVRGGKSIDTSMGFTPLEGLMMGTRSGDMDTAVAIYLMQKEHLTPFQIEEILNKKSGLLGVSGLSNDIRVIKQKAKKGNQRARLALEMFIYRIAKYIGAYFFALGGADAVVFTAGVGENNPDFIARIRKSIHRSVGKRLKVLVVPTDEELMIATLTHKLLAKRGVRK